MRKTETIAKFVVDNAAGVGVVLVLATSFFLYPIANAALTAFGHALPGPVVRIDSSARDLFPAHRFIRAQDKFEGHFGNASPVALMLVVQEGTIFTPETLAKLKRITKALDGNGFGSQREQRDAMRDRLEETGTWTPEMIWTELNRHFPPYPVNHDQTRSLVHWSTRLKSESSDGAQFFEVLTQEIPESDQAAAEYRERVVTLAPEVIGQHITFDQTAALVTAQFVTDRLSNMQIYRAVFEHVQRIVDEESEVVRRIERR